MAFCKSVAGAQIHPNASYFEGRESLLRATKKKQSRCGLGGLRGSGWRSTEAVSCERE
jgi:hypothetical protein